MQKSDAAVIPFSILDKINLEVNNKDVVEAVQNGEKVTLEVV